MLSQQEVQEKYDGMVERVAGGLGVPVSQKQAADTIEDTICLAVLGAVLEKSDDEISADVLAMACFIHRENPSILSLIVGEKKP